MHKIFGWLVIVAVPLAVLELGSYAFVQIRDSRFSERAHVLERLAAEGGKYARFLEVAYHPVYGWDKPAAVVQASKDCLGRAVRATIEADRSRIMPDVPAGPEVLLVGDSFAAGAEVNDTETFAWRLAELLDRPVRNHGVGGFGPAQALLKFEALTATQPLPAVAVLAIMHENVKRMLTRYRPILNSGTGELFGFKPYMADGAVQPNPNGPEPRPLDELPELINAAYEEDFYALPEPRFPFTLRVAQLLASPAFWFEAGPLDRYFESPAIRAELEALVERFVTKAERLEIEPVVLFLPWRRFDRAAPEPAIAELEERFGERLTVVAFGRTEMDWTTYLIGADDCHPSPAGHAAIARVLAPVLAPLLATAD